jgi:hypothetical protein
VLGFEPSRRRSCLRPPARVLGFTPEAVVVWGRWRGVGDAPPPLPATGETMNTADFLGKLRHYRTTIAGVCTVLGSVLTFAAGWMSTGEIPSTEKWEMLGAGLTIGSGLIAAADGKTVNAVASALPPPQNPPAS